MNTAREEERAQPSAPFPDQVLCTQLLSLGRAQGRLKLQPQQLRGEQHHIIYERRLAAELLREQRPALAVFTHCVSDLHL